MISLLHRYHLTHPLLAAAMFLALTPLSLAAAVVGPLAFYYSRELRDAEIGAGHGVETDWRLLLPFAWNRPGQLGFWPVVATVAALTLWRLL